MSSNRHTTLDSSIAAAIGRARQGPVDNGAVNDNRIQSPLLTAQFAPVPVQGAADSVQTYTLDQLLPPQSGHGRMVTIDHDMATAMGGGIGGQRMAFGGQSAAYGELGGEIQMVETAPGIWDTGFDQSTGSDKPADGTGGDGGSSTPASDPRGVVGGIVESEMPTAPCPPPRRWVKEYYYRPGGALSWRWVCKLVDESTTAIGVPGGGSGIGVPPATLAECKCEIEIPKPIEIDLSKKPKGVYPVPLTAKDLRFRVRVWLRGNDPSKRNVTLEALPAAWITSISPNPSTDHMCYPVDTAEFDVTISENWVRSQLLEIRESESGEKKYQIRFKADAGNAKCEKLVDVVLKTCSIVELDKKAQALTKSPLVLTLDGPHVHHHNLPILEELRDEMRSTNPKMDAFVQVGTARMKAVLKYFIGVIESAPDCCCEYLLDVRLTIDISITVDDRAGSASSQVELAMLRSEIPHLLARSEAIFDGLKTLYPVCNSFDAAVPCREKKWYVDDRVGADLEKKLWERIHALPEWFATDVGAVHEVPNIAPGELTDDELWAIAVGLAKVLLYAAEAFRAEAASPDRTGRAGQNQRKGKEETDWAIAVGQGILAGDALNTFVKCMAPGFAQLAVDALTTFRKKVGARALLRLLLAALQHARPHLVSSGRYEQAVLSFRELRSALSPSEGRALLVTLEKLTNPDVSAARLYQCCKVAIELFILKITF